MAKEPLKPGGMSGNFLKTNIHALEFSHRNRTLYYVQRSKTDAYLMGVNIDNLDETWELPTPATHTDIVDLQEIALDWVSGNW